MLTLSLGWNNYFDGLDLLDTMGIIIWGQKSVIYFSLNRYIGMIIHL